MTIFLDKKERVYDLRLTSYGKYLLSVGKFKPIYYGFYDDNILYDDRYGRVTGSQITSIPIGQNAGQNYAQRRIKEETQYLGSMVLFEQAEGTSPDYTENIYTSDMTPTQQEVKIDAFRFDSLIGDAYLDADSRKLPAWKIIALKGEISASTAHDLKNDSMVPQIDMELNYTLQAEYYDDVIQRSMMVPETVEDLTNLTMPFKDGRVITLRMDNVLMYVDEVNTSLLTENFDMEVFEYESDIASEHASGSLYFIGQPVNNNTLTIHNNNATEVFLFKTTLTDPAVANEVEIGSTVKDTVANLASVINTYLSSLYVTATNETTSTTSESYLYVTNQYKGIKGNLPRASFDVTGTATTSIHQEKIEQFQGGVNQKESLRRLQFDQHIPQIVNGMMMSEQQEYGTDLALTTSSVDYFFDMALDQDISADVACKGAEEYNKQSYYIDLDFDCDPVGPSSEPTVYDIYGPVTEPEICQD